MEILQEYLDYLYEDSLIEVGGELAAAAKAGAHQTIWFGAVVTPAVILGWRAANFLFSKASRKCDAITKSGTPGFKVCVAKERIKALEQKLIIAKQALSKCTTSKNPDLCRQKTEIEIEKAKNRIEIEKNTIKELIGESKKIQEQGVGAVAGMAVAIGAGMAADKAIFLGLRTAQAMFSKSSRKCGIYKQGPERNACIAKFKLQSLTKQLSLFNSLLAKSKNEKQREKVSDKIEKCKSNIQLQKDNILGYEKEDRLEAQQKALKNEK